jgi:hypothetical protein
MSAPEEILPQASPMGHRALPQRMDHRTAIQWMLTAAAAVALFDRSAFGVESAGPAKSAKGYGTDPDLLKNYQPGELWPLTFNETQRRAATALCDTIIPADAKSPAASAVGVPDFIDEWISAPYSGHDKDRVKVLEGLAWLDAESQRRFGGSDFSSLVVSQKHEICDDIRHVPDARPELKKAAEFFTKFRDLTAGGFYSTPVGMKDLGYIGNMALATFEGPPPEVLKKLGLNA